MAKKPLTDRERAALDSYLLNKNTVLCFLMSRERPSQSESETALKVMANRWLRDDRVKAYLDMRRTSLSSLFGGGGTAQEQTTETSSKRNRSKDDVVGELNDLISAETDSKRRADLLMRLAELQQMKRVEEDSQKETIHVFLPLSCLDCELYQRHEKERRETGDRV